VCHENTDKRLRQPEKILVSSDIKVTSNQ